MGGLATLHFGLTYPDRARSLLVAGAGYGSEKAEREKFRNEAVIIADKLEKEGMAAFAQAYAYGPTRVQFENKDPRGFAEFKAMLAEHSAKGSANTQLGVQRERPSIFELEDQSEEAERAHAGRHRRRGLAVPAPRRLHQAHVPISRAARHPQQRPRHQHRRADAFNAALADFLAQVDAGRWPMRDPRAISQSITGMTITHTMGKRSGIMPTRVSAAPNAGRPGRAHRPHCRGHREVRAANEALGQLTPEVVDKLHEQRLFRMLLPRAYGGEEIDLPTWFSDHGGAGQARRQHRLVHRPDERLRGNVLRRRAGRRAQDSGASRARR